MQKDAAGSGRRVSVSDPGNGSHAGSYPHACGLPAAVLYFRYDQDHERESCTSDVPCTSGAEKRTVGRTLVEPVLLCRDRSREQVSAYIEGQKEKEKRKP